MSVTTLKKHLSYLDQDTLMKLLVELARYKKENMDLLETRLLGKSNVLENCKKAVRKCIFNKFEEPNLRAAKSIINDFRKVAATEELIDLMIFYIEQGTKFTLKYGDINENFYNSMEHMYRNVIEMLSENSGLAKKFHSRMKQLVVMTNGIGWGYHDGLKDAYGKLVKSM